jgi:hypothetical protein
VPECQHGGQDPAGREVQERGEYAEPYAAERAARIVLAARRPPGRPGAVELADRLPETFALILLNPLQTSEPLSPERFVRVVAAWIEGASEKVAEILMQLPEGYDLLFGRPQAA